jgi:hypothetical protein
VGTTTKAPIVAKLSTAAWATELLATINSGLPKNQKPIALSGNNVANIQRWIGVESSGNTAGFLRDNNPLNLNTYTSPHSSLPGGTIVNEWGVNVQTFPSIQEGLAQTAKQILQAPALVRVLQQNGSPSLFGGALSTSAWSSGSYANAAKFPTLTPFTGFSAEPDPNVGIGWKQFLTDPFGDGESLGKSFNKSSVGKVVNAPINDAKNAVKAVSSVGGLISDITNPTTLKNVGIFVAGLALIVGGMVIFFASTKTAKVAEGAAIKAA